MSIVAQPHGMRLVKTGGGPKIDEFYEHVGKVSLWIDARVRKQ